MQVTQTNAEGLKREYRIVVPADEIEARVVEKLDGLRERVQIKGFRPGKAPLALLRKRYESSLMGEVLEETVNSSSQQALLDQGVRPALQPEIEIENFENGADLAFKLSIEALPEIDPGDLKGLALTRLKAEVADDAVDEALTRMAEQQKTFADAPEDRAAASGDAVRIDFVGRIDGEPFEGGSSEDFQLELGSGRFLPGFEDQLVGAKAGEEREVSVHFPESYPGEQVAGKEAVFAVAVKRVQLAEIPAVDDAFAARLGLADLDALKGAVREQIQRDYGAASRMRLKRDILDRLAETHGFEVPAGMVDREFESIWHQIEHDMEHAGTTWAESDQSEEEARADYRKIAERRVRLGLLLSEIGRRNNITVPQEELNRAVMDQARRYPGQERQVFEHFRNNPEAMNALQAPLYEEKVIDFLIELAEVSDKTVSAEELLREPEPETEAAGAAAAPKKKKAGTSKGRRKKADTSDKAD